MVPQKRERMKISLEINTINEETHYIFNLLFNLLRGGALMFVINGKSERWLTIIILLTLVTFINLARTLIPIKMKVQRFINFTGKG